MDSEFFLNLEILKIYGTSNKEVHLNTFQKVC